MFQNFYSAFCNFDGFFTGFCESCSKFKTKHDCENDGLPEKGAAECVKVCFNGNWIYLIDINYNKSTI